jgi:hypothetical protein
MADKYAISGARPPEMTDGLGTPAAVKALLEDPSTTRLIVGQVVNAKTVTNHRKGTVHPVVEVVHWELVPPEHRKAVADALGAALAARTGAAELPFEPGSELPPDDSRPDNPEDEAIQ